MGNAIVKYKGLPKNDSWIRWMNGRVFRRNKNNMISFVGQTGSGKTYSAISCAEKMSKLNGVEFTIDNIVFSLTELMDLINDKKLRQGSCIIFDEPQVSISARDLQSEANKVFNLLVSTFRHRNLTLFFCTPFETLLDRNTRRLFHARFEMLSINKNNNTCRVKPRYLEHAEFKVEPYRKQMIIFYKDEKGMNHQEKLFFWDINIPSKELIEQYEKKKCEFTDNLNKNISQRLKTFDESGRSMTSKYAPKDDRKELTEKQLMVMKTLANCKTKQRFLDVGKELGINQSTVHEHYTAALKKRYNLDEFKEDITNNA